MISAGTFRKMALNFNQVSEKAHFNKVSFRIKATIFATLDCEKKSASLKLSATDQSIYCQIRPAFSIPANGAWGKQGWTIIDLNTISKSILTEMLKKAYINVAPKEKEKTATPKNADKLIQTLHPDTSKTNKSISLEKYNTIKAHLLTILQSKELTHTELMECLYQNVKDSFVGGVQWYGETVKLDLEARQIIERTGSKPEKYRIRAANR